MRIFKEQHKELSDTEVLIRYAERTEQVDEIERLLHAMEKTIPARQDRKLITLFPKDIFYIESVDKKTFIYGQKEVYSSQDKLYQLEKMLADCGFLRIRKNCLVNRHKLASLKILPNSHIEASLKNGERLLVTRKYISAIRQSFEHSS